MDDHERIKKRKNIFKEFLVCRLADQKKRKERESGSRNK